MKPNSTNRCPWAGSDPLYQNYHDNEWGVPKFDDQALFEKLCLEGFQAGLSWITILRKRETFREAFDHFDAEKIVLYDQNKINNLLGNPGIIRNKLKINATIHNARLYLKLQEAQGFSNFLWDFVDGVPIQNSFKLMDEVPAETPLSQSISKELKRMGFKFCGPTIMYAFMQSVGMVNDHLTSCPCHKKCKKLAKEISS